MNAAERAILRELVKLKNMIKGEEEIAAWAVDQPFLAALRVEVKELKDALKALKEAAK